MFDELQIRNFQSIAKADLKLGRITVIIGPSYRGKSAVVRALRTLTKNRFESSFMKSGTTKTAIMLKEGDTSIGYVRDSSTRYTFSKNPEPFTKIGRTVPQEIAEYLNMDELVFDTDLALDLNIQRQFDPPFMLQASGFELAKIFGKIMNLDLVLSASRDISKDIQVLAKEKDGLNSIINISIDYIRDHYSVELKNSLLQEALAADAQLEEAQAQIAQLEDLLIEWFVVEETLASLVSLQAFLETQSLDSLEQPPVELEDLIAEYSQNEILLGTLTSIQDSLKASEGSFDDSLSLLEDLLVDVFSTNHLLEQHTSLFESISTYPLEDVSALETVQALITEGDSINRSFNTLRAEYLEVQKQQTSTEAAFADYIAGNNICPLAGIPFSQECLTHIKEGV